MKNQNNHLKKCVINFSESKIWNFSVVRLFVHSVVGYDFFAKDPIIVSQFWSEHGEISDFQFFWKSLKNQNDHLKKVCDELFRIKNLRWHFCSSVRALRCGVWLFCRRPHNSVLIWVRTRGDFWFSIFLKIFEKSKWSFEKCEWWTFRNQKSEMAVLFVCPSTTSWGPLWFSNFSKIFEKSKWSFEKSVWWTFRNQKSDTTVLFVCSSTPSLGRIFFAKSP